MMKLHFRAISVFLIVLACCSVGIAQTTQEDWQNKAVADYPQLGVQGSELNLKYIQRARALRATDPAFFQNPRWPYTLAEELSKKSIIPGLEEVTPVGKATTTTAYVDHQKVEVVQAKDIAAKGTQGQKICLEGIVVEASQRALSAKDKFTLKLSPDIMCEFLVPRFYERNRNALTGVGYISYSSEAKLVFENNGLSIHAPPAYKKPAVKVAQILKSGEKVLIYGEYGGIGFTGVEKGHLLKDCVLVRPSSTSSP